MLISQIFSDVNVFLLIFFYEFCVLYYYCLDCNGQLLVHAIIICLAVLF